MPLSCAGQKVTALALGEKAWGQREPLSEAGQASGGEPGTGGAVWAAFRNHVPISSLLS